MADEGTTTDNPDPEVQREESPAPTSPPPASRPVEDRDSEPASGAASPESADEIDLTEGKTLSDYLEDEPDAAKPKSAPAPAVEYRSIPNVEKMVVPPPGGLMRKPGEEASEPREGAEGSRGAGKPAAASSQAGGAAGPPRAPASSAEGKTTPTPAAPRPPAPKPRRSAPVIEEGSDGEFGKMLEGSMKARSFDQGETVKGIVVAIGPDVAFLDIGGKSEATIDIAELRDDEGDIEVEVGETIEALVVGTDGGLKLSRRLARGAAAKEHLGEAFRAGLPVEGKVEKTIKGGYEVRIAGARAFCPFSQMDLQKTADPNVHVGKAMTFRIIEYKEGGKNIILSRRALLQEEERALAEETRKSIVPDAVLKGKVVSVRDYGAFVDLGGIQGLLHVSEMGWARVTNPAEIVKPGDELTVKVLRIDSEKGRISLGLKQLQPDPWSRAAETYPIGKVVNGEDRAAPGLRRLRRARAGCRGTRARLDLPAHGHRRRLEEDRAHGDRGDASRS
jgi:predicted RNA-binding protein with RPS1 domain